MTPDQFNPLNLFRRAPKQDIPQNAVENNGSKELNNLVSFKEEKGMIYLFLKEGGLENNFDSLFHEAMVFLAKKINQEHDQEVQMIEVTSWFVAKHHNLFTREGFNVEDLNIEDSKGRKTALASIHRKEFFKKFPGNIGIKI